ncbi:hypothetical protein CALCODRAFT_211521 [Calocera cornea HHB12733]|uniref:Uncharacterized protein n=1 Tax=Calocera cornea HHB12733 TaxID=1353952 RepID=A0A165C2N5_9BASI|nr:hypothetical protein CALCODRAFT_211521 [Calocera cornea HHB12733]
MPGSEGSLSPTHSQAGRMGRRASLAHMATPRRSISMLAHLRPPCHSSPSPSHHTPPLSARPPTNSSPILSWALLESRLADRPAVLFAPSTHKLAPIFPRLRVSPIARPFSLPFATHTEERAQSGAASSPHFPARTPQASRPTDTVAFAFGPRSEATRPRCDAMRRCADTRGHARASQKPPCPDLPAVPHPADVMCLRWGAPVPAARVPSTAIGPAYAAGQPVTHPPEPSAHHPGDPGPGRSHAHNPPSRDAPSGGHPPL